MANVSVSNARKDYGAFHAIKGVSVEIGNGEFVVLVGPSGCGKSTLLRMIAGLEGITSGAIQIGPHVVNELPPKDRNIAMVFQNYALYPHMTVAQNMGFALRMKRMPRTDVKARVDRAARILGLEDLLERYPKQLSGGQRQRVAMGRAIVRDPAVFLFDEPLSNLDAKLRVQMRSEIKELHQRLKTTTIYVTHDQIEAMTMADKIVVMRDGRIEQMGSPLDLYDRPNNIFVAGFIGSPAMNFIKGTMGEAGFTSTDGLTLPTLEKPINAVTYGIRPENMHLDPNGIEIRIVVLEPTGSETLVIAKLGDQTITCVFRERIRAQPGETLRITPDISAIHLFDAEGARAV